MVEGTRRAEGACGVGLIEPKVAVSIFETDGKLAHFPVGGQSQFSQARLGGQRDGRFTPGEEGQPSR